MFQSRNDRLRRLEARVQEQLQIQQSTPDARIETLTEIIAAETVAMELLRRVCPEVNQDNAKRDNDARLQELKSLCEQNGENWSARCARLEETLAKYNRPKRNTR